MKLKVSSCLHDGVVNVHVSDNVMVFQDFLSLRIQSCATKVCLVRIEEAVQGGPGGS